jgi:hypothetical protein
MKKPVVISVVVLLSLIVAACSSPTASSPTPAANSASAAVANAAPAGEDLTQTNNEAMVTVAVTPLNLNDKSAAALDFKIALNTHSVDLGYDLLTIATLSNDAGEKVQPTKWDGPAGGGHHRGGTLSFPPLKTRGQALTLTLRGIADVPERTFTWKVN